MEQTQPEMNATLLTHALHGTRAYHSHPGRLYPQKPRKAYTFDVATTLKSRRRRSLTSSPQDIAQNGFRNISRDELRACVVNAWTRYAVGPRRHMQDAVFRHKIFGKMPRHAANATLVARRRHQVSLPVAHPRTTANAPAIRCHNMEYRELST
jgi:hypothetical protein